MASSHEQTDEKVEYIQALSGADGQLCSPIELDIKTTIPIGLPRFEWINYDCVPDKFKVTNTGFSAIVSGKWSGRKPAVKGGPLASNYVFAQIHFHWGEDDNEGSEHIADGESFPLEMHVVHYKEIYGSHDASLTKPDGLLIVVYMFRIIPDCNPNIQPVIEALPRVLDPLSSTYLEPQPVEDFIHMFDSDYLLYWGSVETSNSSHCMLWIVSRVAIGISSKQMASFRSMRNWKNGPLINNFRHPKPVGTRSVFIANSTNVNPPTIFLEVATPMEKLSQPAPQETKLEGPTAEDISVKLSSSQMHPCSAVSVFDVLESGKTDPDSIEGEEKSGEKMHHKEQVVIWEEKNTDNKFLEETLQETEIEEKPVLEESIELEKLQFDVGQSRATDLKYTKQHPPSTIMNDDCGFHNLTSNQAMIFPQEKNLAAEDKMKTGVQPSVAPVEVKYNITIFKAAEIGEQSDKFLNAASEHVVRNSEEEEEEEEEETRHGVLDQVKDDMKENSIMDFEVVSGKDSWPFVDQKFESHPRSPIDIRKEDIKNVVLPPLDLQWMLKESPEYFILSNTGMTVRLSQSDTKEVAFTLEGGPLKFPYMFQELHFHWESEHVFNGQRFPLEAHMVFIRNICKSFEEAYTMAGGFTVIGFIFEESKVDNESFEEFLYYLKDVQRPYTSKKVPSSVVRWLEGRTLKTGYYTYPGSLTTHFHNEIVTWIIYSYAIPISKKQVDQFRTLEEGGHFIKRNYYPSKAFDDNKPLFYCVPP